MWYLKSAFDAYRNVQDTVQARLSDVRTAAMAPLSLVKNILGGGSSPEDELERLRRRVAELEALQGEPRRRKAARKRST